MLDARSLVDVWRVGEWAERASRPARPADHSKCYKTSPEQRDWFWSEPRRLLLMHKTFMVMSPRWKGWLVRAFAVNAPSIAGVPGAVGARG